MKNLFLALATLAMFACNAPQAGENESTGDSSQTSLEQTQAAEVLEADKLLADMDAFSAKNVAVKGLVVHVCKHGGKKLHLVGTDGEKKLIVDATDVLGSFERELEGSDVVIEGTLEETRIDEATLAAREAEIKANHTEDIDDEHVQEELAAIAKQREEVQASEKGYVSRFRLQATKLSKSGI